MFLTAALVLTLRRSRLGAAAVLLGLTPMAWSTLPSVNPSAFAIAGAVVSDVGGVMSHCAIVAREFDIPAVVGSVSGTARIETGQVVTVDGTNGNVWLDGREL